MRILLATSLSVFVLLFNCKIVDDNVNKNIPLPEHFIDSEIIIQLHSMDDHTSLIQDLETYGTSLKKSIAPYPPMIMISYDTKRIEPRKMLDKIKNHPKVKDANFNKKTGQRGS